MGGVYIRFSVLTHRLCSMRRRLALALATIGNPPVIIMDEPTKGMDLFNKRRVWDFIHLLKPDKLMILCTHYMGPLSFSFFFSLIDNETDEAEYLGDQVAVLSSGRVAALGTPEYLKHRYGHSYRVEAFVEVASTMSLHRQMISRCQEARLLSAAESEGT